MIVRVVDDEPMIVDLVGEVIRRAGHEVRGASTEAEVRSLLDPIAWVDVDAVLCDLVMPGVSGVELLAYVARVTPHVRRVLLTGNDEDHVPEGVEAHVVLEKPMDLGTILGALGHAR